MHKQKYSILNESAIAGAHRYDLGGRSPYTLGIPLLESADKVIDEIYYFRFHTYAKHIRETPCGFVVTEFYPDVPWAGPYNTINCPASHHFYEGRWFHDTAFLEDYARFWLTDSPERRKYSFPMPDAYLAMAKATGNEALLRELLPAMLENDAAWDRERRTPSGLYTRLDNYDGMEFSIGGHGYRPTINSYMYADAVALAEIAARAGEHDLAARYRTRASEIRALILSRLWDKDAEFFKVVHEDGSVADVREEIGYIPWCYGIPTAEHDAAWRFLLDENHFAAPFGITTAERCHPRFMEWHEHECLWNGPVWPFATSQTLTAMANRLREGHSPYITRADYHALLHQYAMSQHLTENGVTRPFIDEDLDPMTGEWIARRRLHEMANPPGGADRGIDYNHSTFCDLVISGLCGIRCDMEAHISVKPLFNGDDIPYLCLDGVKLRGHFLTFLWDRDGGHFGHGRGMQLLRNGKAVFTSPTLADTELSLPMEN